MTIDTINFQVPPYFSDVSNTQMFTAKSLVGQDFTNMALNANYLLGNGNQTIPTTYIGEQLSNIQYFYQAIDYVQPNTNERYWMFSFGGGGGTAAASIGSVGIAITSSLYGTITTSSLLIVTGSSSTFFNESVNMISSSYDVDEIILALSVSNATATVFEQLSLIDAPRTFMNPTTQASEFAIDVASNNVGKPLFTTPSKHNSSYAGIVNATYQYHNNLKTGKGLWSYFRAYKTSVLNPNWASANVFYANSTTQRNGFTDGLLTAAPIIFATQNNKTDQSRVCRVWAFGAVKQAGDVGVIAFSSSIEKVSLTFNSATPTWKSASFTIPTENVLAPLSGGMAQMISNITGTIDINLWKSTHTLDQFNVWSVQIFEE